MPRAPCSRKTNGTYFFYTCSDRHELGLCLLCAGVIALLLCCAVLAVQRQHTYSYILLLLYCCCCTYTGTEVPPATLAHKEAWIAMADTYIVIK